MDPSRTQAALKGRAILDAIVPGDLEEMSDAERSYAKDIIHQGIAEPWNIVAETVVDAFGIGSMTAARLANGSRCSQGG